MSIDENGFCYICGNPAILTSSENINLCECNRCGKYSFYPTNTTIDPHKQEIQVRLSGWIQKQNKFGIEPLIKSQDLIQIEAMKMPSLRERSLLLLNLVYDQFRYPDQYFSIHNIEFTDPNWLGVTYSKSEADIELLIKVLCHTHFMHDHGGSFSLTIGGILKIEESQNVGAEMSQGFVAMSFSDELNSAWTDGFDPAIRDAGFTPTRIDGKEYLGGISDEIIVEIRASRFIVADYTQQKNGVYFEAGFAVGLGLPVIPTVHKNEVASLHFDIKHLNTITWDNPTDLKKKLSKRIMAVIGRGPMVA